MFPTIGADDDLNNLLYGRHECRKNCGMSWIQDLSPFAYMIKLDDVRKGTKAVATHPPPHKLGPQKKWYAVLRGQSVGVFNNWDEAGNAVNFISGSRYHGAASEEEAYSVFIVALHSGRVSITHKRGRGGDRVE
ncbi:hypothetical protein BJ322DRAFT_1025180 [Thelephora terrestris]|uniref:Ribonuclease H1 N-terminal domain-containing protein n=1 Tax=Thelephora terrestris TaxID=56493 RepID=A0A9P6H5J3_9AGAM|nr:hypothetical protein BJ322DRAFT_1025180 [Thelephora terrestris]